MVNNTFNCDYFNNIKVFHEANKQTLEEKITEYLNTLKNKNLEFSIDFHHNNDGWHVCQIITFRKEVKDYTDPR